MVGWLVVLLVAAGAEPAGAQANRSLQGRFWVFVGTYTGGGKGKGIYRMELDPATGKLTEPVVAAEATDPSFLDVHPSRRFLYSVNEVASVRGMAGGGVSAFAFDPQTGALTFLNQQSSRGAGPCHVFVGRTGRAVLVANYGGGSVAALPLAEDGRLGVASAFVQHRGAGADPKRQEGPHAHSINLDLNNRFAVAADLGLDRLFVYRFDPVRATLTPHDPPFVAVPPGSGPRHFAFHPDNRHAYVINELKNTVIVFDYDPEAGTLRPVQEVTTLPADFRGPSFTAEVQVHRSGLFLYGSNRGHDSLAIFAVEGTTGRLRPVGHQPSGGKNPRNFGLDPSGRFLLAANQDSDSVVVFRIEASTGKLEPTGTSVTIPAPVCVRFLSQTR